MEFDIWTLKTLDVSKDQMSISVNDTGKYIGSEYALHNRLVQMEYILNKVYLQVFIAQEKNIQISGVDILCIGILLMSLLINLGPWSSIS